MEGTIENCYNIKNVMGQENIGGILGITSSVRTKTVNCYNTGENIKNEIIGYTTFDAVKNCYKLIDTFTAADLGDAFKDDTENINDGYPLLTWE